MRIPSDFAKNPGLMWAVLVLAVALVGFGCQRDGAAAPSPSPTPAEVTGSLGARLETPVVIPMPSPDLSSTPADEPLVEGTPVPSPPPVVTHVPSPPPAEEDVWVNVPGKFGVSEHPRHGTLYKEAFFSCGPALAPYFGNSLANVLLWTPDSSHLVFSSGGTIWTVDEQGAQLDMVLNALAGATPVGTLGFLYGFHADLSPDSARLTYTSCQFPTEYDDPDSAQAVITQDGLEWYERTKYSYEIALSGLDGGDLERLTHTRTSDEHYPAWSPSGDRIAFMRGTSGSSGQLYTMAPDGSDVQSLGLVDMRVALVPPAWSPDGQRLAFVVNEGKGYAREQRNIYTVRPDGSELTKVGEMGDLRFAYSSLTAAPTWSPDSERLAFQGFNSEELAIYTIRFDGSDLRPVWNGNDDINPKAVSQVSWSPDGSELLIVGDGVHVLHLDGGGLRQLSVPAGPDTVAAWSPDGSRIATYKTETWHSPRTGLYTVSRDGMDLRVLVEKDANGNLVPVNPQNERSP